MGAMVKILVHCTLHALKKKKKKKNRHKYRAKVKLVWCAYRLLAAIGELHRVSSHDILAVGVFVMAEVIAGVFVLYSVCEVIWHSIL